MRLSVADHTVNACLPLPVASQALAHGEILNLSYLDHAFHGPMAGLARDLGPNMRPMLKINKVGKSGYLLPRDAFFLIPVLLELLHFGLIRARDLVAPHASLERRDACDGGPPRIDVAILTCDPVIPCMNFMAECDRLRGRRGISGKSKPSFQSRRHENQDNPDTPVFHLQPCVTICLSPDPERRRARRRRPHELE